MKKLIATLLVLALAIPAMAADVSLIDNEDGTGTIVLTVGVDEVVRGLAIVVDAGVDITAVEGTDAIFNVFMDAAFSAADATPGYMLGDGTPIADPDAAGELALVAGISRISLCMGILDESGAQGGAAEGTYTIATITTGAATVTITADTLRGGIVGDALNTPVITDGDITDVDVPVCVGDVDGSAQIDTVDLSALVTLLVDNKTIVSGSFGDIIKYEIASTDAAYALEADVDGSGQIDTVDLTALVTLLVDNKTIISGSFGDIIKYEIACE